MQLALFPFRNRATPASALLIFESVYSLVTLDATPSHTQTEFRLEYVYMTKEGHHCGAPVPHSAQQHRRGFTSLLRTDALPTGRSILPLNTRHGNLAASGAGHDCEGLQPSIKRATWHRCLREAPGCSCDVGISRMCADTCTCRNAIGPRCYREPMMSGWLGPCPDSILENVPMSESASPPWPLHHTHLFNAQIVAHNAVAAKQSQPYQHPSTARNKNSI